jgi:hypothetical protein
LNMTDNSRENKKPSDSTAGIDPYHLELVKEWYRRKQNPGGAAIAGALAMIAALGLWAAASALSHRQLGFMSVAVGLMVGVSIRRVGRGIDPRFGLLGAALALLGCLIGTLLACCSPIAAENDIPSFTVLSLLDPANVKNVLSQGISPTEWVLFGITAAISYSLAFKRITSREVDALLTHKQDEAN